MEVATEEKLASLEKTSQKESKEAKEVTSA